MNDDNAQGEAHFAGCLDYTETDDPVESKRRIAEWIRANGPPTHALLWCAANVITRSGKPITVVVKLSAPVLPSGAQDSADIVHASRLDTRKRVEAAQIDPLDYCRIPVAIVTSRPDDILFLVRLRKIGVVRLPASPRREGHYVH